MVFLIPVVLLAETADVVFYNTGVDNFNKKNYAAACDYFGQAADLNKNNVWAKFYYAYSLVMLNKPNEAIKVIPSLAPLSQTPQYNELIKLIYPKPKSQKKQTDSAKNEPQVMNFETTTMHLTTESCSISSYTYDYGYNIKHSSRSSHESQKTTKKSKLDEVKELVDANKNKEAIEILNAELKKNRKNGKVYELLGLAYYNEQDYPSCIANLTYAFKYGIDNFNSYFIAAEASANLQKTDDALKWYLKADKKNKKDPFVKLAIADIYCSQSDYTKATKIYKDMLKTDKNYVDASIGLANIELEKGFIQKAFDQVVDILKDIPDSSKARFLKAKIHLEKKEYDLALEEAVLAYTYSPANIEYKIFGSLVKVRNLLTNEAINELKQILIKFPNNAYALAILGEALLTNNQTAEGEKILLKADSIKELPETAELLALIEAAKGKYDTAENLYKEFCSRSGNNPKSLLAYAEFTEIKQDGALSQKAYQTIVDRFPETPFAKKAKIAIERLNGMIQIEKGNKYGYYGD